MFRTEDERLFFRESTIRFRDLRNLNPYHPTLDNICFFRSKEDFIYHSHIHEFYELIIPGNSGYSCILNGTNLKVPVFNVLTLQPGDRHQDVLKTGQRFFAITFKIEASDPLFKEEKIFRKNSSGNERLCAYSDTGDVNDILQLLLAESKLESEMSYYILNGLFQAFFWTVITKYSNDVLNPFFIKNSFQENFKDNLLRVFQMNIYSKFSVKEMAMAMKLSPRALERSCRRIMGMPPAKAFIDYKLKEIERFVRHSQLSIREISDKFGFENQFHFSRLFKKHFGKSPLQYRIYKQEWP